PEVVVENTAPEVNPEDKVFHDLTFSAAYRFTTLTAEDRTTSQKAEINSSRDVDLGISWAQRWSSTWKTYGSFTLRSISFEPTLKGTKSLANKEKSLGQLRFGAIQRITNNFDLGYFGAYS